METLSLSPFRQVLAWAAEQGMSVRDQLSEEQLVALERVFSGKEPWTFQHYWPLRAFGLALARLNVPVLPTGVSFGHAFQALDELQSTSLASWPTHDSIMD